MSFTNRLTVKGKEQKLRKEVFLDRAPRSLDITWKRGRSQKEKSIGQDKPDRGLSQGRPLKTEPSVLEHMSCWVMKNQAKPIQQLQRPFDNLAKYKGSCKHWGKN